MNDHCINALQQSFGKHKAPLIELLYQQFFSIVLIMLDEQANAIIHLGKQISNTVHFMSNFIKIKERNNERERERERKEEKESKKNLVLQINMWV